MAERLRRLDSIFPNYTSPLWFVTFTTKDRKPLLANGSVNAAFRLFGETARSYQIFVGRYVIMPEHVHLFVAGGPDLDLNKWSRNLKLSLSPSIAIPRPHWQEGFFDRLLRSGESYAEKWEYVRMNPVEAGLASRAEDWPYQGEINELRHD